MTNTSKEPRVLLEDEMHWDEFWGTYKPKKNHLDENAELDGFLYQTYGEDYEYIKQMYEKDPDRVWTFSYADSLYPCISKGLNWVNREGYLITENPACGAKGEECITDPDDNDEIHRMDEEATAQNAQEDAEFKKVVMSPGDKFITKRNKNKGTVLEVLKDFPGYYSVDMEDEYDAVLLNGQPIIYFRDVIPST